MALKIKAILKEKMEVNEFTKKDGGKFRKRSFIIETENKYNNIVCFDILKDDVIQMLDNFSVGNEIEVDFNLSSREYNGKYYHNLVAWRLTKVEKSNVEKDDDPF